MKKVVKFGGSSLASAEQFTKVKDIICSDIDRRYVVPSAPGKRFSGDTKVTDMLYTCYAAAEQDEDFSDKLAKIQARYNEIINGLGLNLSLDTQFEEIASKFAAKAGKEYAASRGEYLNGIIMANYLGYEFVDAAEVIRFNHDGSFNAAVTNKIMSKRLEKVERAVIPGFFGAEEDGTIRTFSRGGSDITGSIVARAVNANLYENWTDVSGFLMADPRIVDSPKAIEKITYRELRELAYMGASVLHEDAVFPVRQAGIPINIKNTNKPEDAGTLIVKESEKEDIKTITGVAGKKDFTVISVEKAMMNSELGFCRKLLGILEMNGICFENMPCGIDTVCVVVSDSDLKGKRDKVIEEIKRTCDPDNIEIHPNMSLIAVVGKGMASNKGVAARVCGALADASVNIRMIDQGSSEINILIGTENDDFEAAIKAVYNEFN